VTLLDFFARFSPSYLFADPDAYDSFRCVAVVSSPITTSINGYGIAWPQ
jgi:hypothetical protein